VITRTPGVFAQDGMKSGAEPLVMFQPPAPSANAIGMEDQPGLCRTSAMSV
jgi:hypothetical protein